MTRSALFLLAASLLAAQTRVILLGTGTPNPDPARSGCDQQPLLPDGETDNLARERDQPLDPTPR